MIYILKCLNNASETLFHKTVKSYNPIPEWNKYAFELYIEAKKPLKTGFYPVKLDMNQYLNKRNVQMQDLNMLCGLLKQMSRP